MTRTGWRSSPLNVCGRPWRYTALGFLPCVAVTRHETSRWWSWAVALLTWPKGSPPSWRRWSLGERRTFRGVLRRRRPRAARDLLRPVHPSVADVVPRDAHLRLPLPQHRYAPQLGCGKVQCVRCRTWRRTEQGCRMTAPAEAFDILVSGPDPGSTRHGRTRCRTRPWTPRSRPVPPG